jgi:hypothetical protein
LVPHIKGRRCTEAVWKQGAEGNISTYDERRMCLESAASNYN